jgi:hypothetical protein
LWNIINKFSICYETNKPYLSLFRKIWNDIDYLLDANKRLWSIIEKEKWLEFSRLFYKCRTEACEDIEEKKYAEAQNKVSTFQKEIKVLKERLLR